MKRTLAAAVALTLSTALAGAQTYPDHTVKIIVPTAPGGTIINIKLAQ